MILHNFKEIAFGLEVIQYRGTTETIHLKASHYYVIVVKQKQLLLVFRTSNKEINSFNKSEAQFSEILITH